MFVDGGKGDLSGPELEGIAVYSETEVAGKGDEEGGFPVFSAMFQTLGYLPGFVFETFGLQSRHPAVQ